MAVPLIAVTKLNLESIEVTINPGGTVSLDGRLVPNIQAVHQYQAGYKMVLDKKMSMEVESHEEFTRLVWFVANAMAVAAGFTEFGEKSMVRNSYGPDAVTRAP